MGVYFDRRDRLWRVQVQKHGRRVSTTARSAEEARALEARFRRDLFLQRLGEKPRRTLEEALLRWLAEYVPQLKRPRDYESHLRALIPHVAGLALDDAPQAWLAYRAANADLTNSTHNRRGAVLRRVCNLARKWGWTTDDLGGRIDLLPENSARHVYLTVADVARLADACKYRPTRDAVLIAAYTGLRLSEIIELQPTDVRDGCLHIGATKSGHPRVVPIHHAIRAAVARLPIPCGKRWLIHHFERARTELGHPEWRFHDLRHTNASWLVQSGADLITVRDLLGHSSLAVTGRYAHLATEHLRVAVMKIGKKR